MSNAREKPKSGRPAKTLGLAKWGKRQRRGKQVHPAAMHPQTCQGPCGRTRGMLCFPRVGEDDRGPVCRDCVGVS